MHPARPCRKSSQAIHYIQPAITMPVPIKHEMAKSRALKLLTEKLYQALDTRWCSMPYCIGQTEARDTCTGRCEIHRCHMFWSGPCRILSDEHNTETIVPCIRHCLLDRCKQERYIPSFN